MRFFDFLRTANLLLGGASTALAIVAIVGANAAANTLAIAIAAGWWAVAAAAGLWLGRLLKPSPGIARLLAAARSTSALPEVEPGTLVIARLWPLGVFTLACGAVAFILPQIPAIAAGYALAVALAWRRQPAAVQAVEDRDGVRFFLEPGSALGAPRLLRAPWARKIDAPLAASGKPERAT